MQQVQLFIGNDRVELFREETISLTQSIQNVKDIAKVFTDFTKTFTVPASKTNNKIFKHYYNFNIVEGFDARTKSNGSIKLNGVDFRKGNIKLEGVDLKENKPNAYRITFFGDLTELKDLIGDDDLSSLTFLDEFYLPYTNDEVRIRLNSGKDVTVNGEVFDNVILAPLISCSKRLYYNSNIHNENDGNLHYEQGTGHRHGVDWDDLKYGIKAYAIIRAIEEKYGIEFTKNGSDDFITSVNDATTLWGSLYLWLHRKSGKYSASVSDETIYNKFIDILEEKQIASYQNFTIRSTNNQLITEGFGVSSLVYSEVKLDILLDTGDVSKSYTLKHFKDGVLTNTLNLTGNQTSLNIPNTSRSFSGTSFNTFEISSSEQITFTQIEFNCSIRDFSTIYAQGTTDITSNFTNAGFEFYPTQQIPEMKIIDFLTGLFKTFNLTAYVQDDGKIKLQTLDDFYNSESSDSPYDITKYVDVNDSKNNAALPFSKIVFKFGQSKSLLAAKFNQLNNKQYGELKYNDDASVNFVGKEYKIETPFEKMLYERLTDKSTQVNAIPDDDIKIQYGLMQNENLQNYIGKPLLFLADSISAGSYPISFVMSDSSHVSVSTYFAPSHTIELGDVSYQSLLFGSEIDPYTKQNMNNSLFETYYKNYIQDVFSPNRRLTKIKAFLPMKILIKYKLADTFIVAGKKYKINSITTNLQTGESDIELLNEV